MKRTLLLTALVLSVVSAIPQNETDSTEVPDFSSTENSTIPEQNLTATKKIRRLIIWSKSLRTDNQSQIQECTGSSEDFPPFFSKEQVLQGAIVLVIFIGIYGFTLLALLCDNYFLPCVERICEALNLSPDVAGATFMSIATTSPELFVNLIGTFLTESDLGIGTVVGSSLFNSLGVAAVGGLAASTPIQLDWWPVTRDVFIYIISVTLLVFITWNGVIEWYEGLILFIAYFLYFIVMFQNERISKFVRRIAKKIKNRNKVADVEKPSEKPKISDEPRGSVVVSAYGSYAEDVHPVQMSKEKQEEQMLEEEEEAKHWFRLPKGPVWKKIFYVYAWPLSTLLRCTVPDPKRYPKLFPITFLMCIAFIGSNSYIVSWMITSIGNVAKIPDAVLGLTFLAAGGSLPETISITIMSRRGEGSIGVSNSLGANTMNILLSLGMPWFLKTMLMGPSANAHIVIESGSITYTITALIIVAFVLYLTLFLNKFRLSRKAGFVLLCIYTVFIVLAILSEMVFFQNSECTPA